jgi:hypothetical protein
VIDTDDGRLYLHRFVKLDGKFRVVGVSRAWVFQHQGIEFCAGIVHERGRVTISYGVEDREAWIVHVAAKDIRAIEWITP